MDRFILGYIAQKSTEKETVYGPRFFFDESQGFSQQEYCSLAPDVTNVGNGPTINACGSIAVSAKSANDTINRNQVRKH